MIAWDAGLLIAYGNPRCDEGIRLRVEALVARTKGSRRIILPAPAVAEYLAGVGSPSAIATAASILQASRTFRIAEFGSRASVEVATTIARIKPPKARKSEGTTWAKAKFDWQIAAIAKVEGADIIYTLDDDIVRAAKHLGIKGVRVDEMDLPDEARQRPLLPPQLSAVPTGRP